jgi:asparagine synthase (glutamine-hydrolysing)
MSRSYLSASAHAIRVRRLPRALPLTRIRRGLAHRLAPELGAELRETKRKLRAARKQVRTLREAALQTPLPHDVERVIARARQERLTYLSRANLRELARVVADLEQRGLPGLIVEAGTALGGSAIVIAAAKAAERPMKVYDVFGMIPAPGEQDGADVRERYETIVSGEARGVGGDTYYGYHDDLQQEVADSFSRLGVPVGPHHVELVPGLFEDTIDLDEPVAFAHLDGDWYESTMTCLTRIAPLLVPGGRLVLDDYYAWSGCRAAVDEFFADREGFRFVHRAKLHVVRE